MPAAQSNPHNGRRLVYFGLGMAIVLCSASQLCWKSATARIAPDATALQTIEQTFLRPTFWVACSLYIWQFFNWMMVLKHADLSFAQPITAGSYVAVGLAAWLVFKEPMPPQRWAGIALILLGVFFISRSPHNSKMVPGETPMEVLAEVEVGENQP